MAKKKKIKGFKRHPILYSILLFFHVFLVFLLCYNSPLFNPERYVKNSLESDGYEVLSAGMVNYLGEDVAYVKMKTQGYMNLEVWNALVPLGSAYKNASTYSVILTENSSICYYTIDGAIYRAYVKSSNSKIPESENNESAELHRKISYEIEKELSRCSPYS